MDFPDFHKPHFISPRLHFIFHFSLLQIFRSFFSFVFFIEIIICELRLGGLPSQAVENFLSRPPSMHLLYLDDSGSVGNASDKHIILAGLSVFERQPHWLSGKLDDLAKEVWPDSPHKLEFRGADIFSGKKHWRGLEKDKRIAVYKRALRILADDKHVRLFGAIVHKAATSPDDPMEYAFEQVCMRFDKFLGRLHKSGDSQRGLIVLDDSTYETSLQSLSKEFRTIGHRWGQLYNLCDVPLFVNSTATRMIQFADIIAYALRRYHEKGEAEYFDIIRDKFDAEGGVLHGLIHYIPSDLACTCYSCRQKKATYAIPHAVPATKA